MLLLLLHWQCGIGKTLILKPICLSLADVLLCLLCDCVSFGSSWSQTDWVLMKQVGRGEVGGGERPCAMEGFGFG